MDAKTEYTIYAKNVDDAIDIKNKILANTIDEEKVRIEININTTYIIN